MAVVQLRAWQPTQADLEHEKRMRDLLSRYNRTQSMELRRKLWDQYKDLHHQRSPEMVAHMERERGLR